MAPSGHFGFKNRPTFSSKPTGNQDNRGIKRKRDSDFSKDVSVDKKHVQVNGAKPETKPAKSNGEKKYTGTKTLLNEKTRALQNARSQLPIWAHTAEIRLGLHGDKDVMILVGETGSGKSTQVPQFMLGEGWCQGMIGITQPRRVAAITLAQRVAQEMGSLLGKDTPASKVGYAVRFDNNTSPSTKIKFVTEGTLLQEMLRDPWLSQYSCIIVDEVHERGVNVDLILGFLRRIVTSSQKERKLGRLKVVIMSATADTEALFSFFDQGYREVGQKGKVLNGATKTNNEQAFEQALAKVNGDAPKTNGVEKSDAGETGSSWSGFSDSDEKEEAAIKPKTIKQSKKEEAPAKPETTKQSKTNSPPKKETKEKALTEKVQNSDEEKETELFSEHISTCYIEGRQHPVETHYLPSASSDWEEAALKTIFQIHYKEPLPGDILVFLTGQDTVESLETLVTEYAAAMGPEVPTILCLPMFAALPATAQQAVFQPTPRNTRKIILATNIAETSVTIPGVRHVIDSGLAKIKEYRTALNLDSLLVKPISRSGAIQRKGRAGREAPGKCYRLYTEADYLNLAAANIPEILRCDLASSLLTMKARGVADVLSFPFLSPPDPTAVKKALLALHRLGALTDTGAISPLGTQMAKLPLPPPLSRVLLAAATEGTDTLLDVIDIVACLTVESVFLPLQSEEKKENAEEARKELYRREGDHLTMMTTLQAYVADTKGDRRAWCERHYVSHRAMKNVVDVRKQLRAQCVALKLLTSDAVSAANNNNSTAQAADPMRAPAILKSFMKGFVGNVARIMPNGSYQTLEGHQTVGIHPSSVVYGKKVEAILYNELVFTTRCYARGVSVVQLDWYADAVEGED